MTTRSFEHIFTSLIPDALEERTLYISINYNTAVHKCACGCGEEVVTPLSPKDWRMTYNGESVTLHPSIGNWSYKCRSHYWIRDDKIVWAESWSNEQVAKARERQIESVPVKGKKNGIMGFLKNFFK